MIGNRDILNTVDTYESLLDKIIECLLILLLLFMPLAFGAVEAWSELMVIAFATAISICFLLKLITDRSSTFIWSWTYVPIFIFILVAIFQLVPIPASLVKTVSPNTFIIKQDLLSDLSDSNSLLKSLTLSFYPYATKHDLRLFISVAAIFLVVINLYRRPDKIKRLLAAITIIGGFVALLALAQDVFGNGKIYWIVPTGYDTANSGTFVNHSHYGQFMNLSIGAAVSLLLIKVHDIFRGKKITPSVVSEYITSGVFKSIWLLLAMVIIGVVTVFMSLTRGGMISMLIAAGFTTLVLSSRGSLKGRGWIMVLLALGAFICVLYLGFDAVYDRLASLQQLHQAEGGRWQIVKDIMIAWTKFPVFGTGLGTHEVVYPMFDRSTIATLAAYAENEYAQAAEETGLIGLTALVVFGLMVWICYVRNIRSSSLLARSVAFGLGFGLMAIMIHSLSDFGQHLPANAFLTAISCALLISLADKGQRKAVRINVVGSTRHYRNFWIAILICISGIWSWALLEANNARKAEASWKKTVALENELMRKNWQGEDEEYIELITNAAEASYYQPDNVKYLHWLNIYRWQSLSRFNDPNTGEVIIPEKAMEYVKRIVDELNDARKLCPTYGATYCIVGQLQKFTLDDPNGAHCIRKGYQLAPCDPTACFVAGLLDVDEQKFDTSFEKFNRAIQLDWRLFPNVVNVFIHSLDRPDLAVNIAGDDIYRLSLVANSLADLEGHKEVFEKAQTRTRELLREKCSDPDVSAIALASLANIYRKERDIESAIESYRRALTLDYGQVHWRYSLARLLAESDKVPEAIHEARICLRLSPQFKPAEKLIADLSVLPDETIGIESR